MRLSPTPRPTAAAQGNATLALAPAGWADTEPMALDLLLPDATQRPFHEALNGLHVRELAGEEFFGLFFGRHTG